MSKCVVCWDNKKIRFRTNGFDTLNRVKNILTWAHKRKFPSVTEDEQLEKVWEEWHELKSAYYRYIMLINEENLLEYEMEYYYEVADVLFALHGYKRFDEKDADGFLADLADYYPISEKAVPLMIEKLLEVYFIRTYVNNRHI